MSLRFALLFQGTGDHIVLESLQDDVLRFYVQCLENAQCNRFEVFNGFVARTQSRIDDLQLLAQEVDQWPPEIRPSWISIPSAEQCLDQALLNRWHAEWVKSMIMPWDIKQKQCQYNSDLTNTVFDQFPDDLMRPTTANVLQKLGRLDRYRQLNTAIHNIESQFNQVRFQSTEWVEFPNPFGPGIASNDVSHFSMSFNHRGRTHYNKWSYFDDDLVCDDENTFREFLPFVEVRLSRSRTNGHPPEYLAWCTQHGISPGGNHVCLGNIPDLEQRLSYYRNMIFKNLAQGNSFSIQL